MNPQKTSEITELHSPAHPHHPGDRPLMWIASYNLAKGALLLLIALGLLGFLHQDVDAIVGRWIAWLGISLENVHVAALLARLDVVTDNQLRLFSGVTFLFSAVFITEGIGLFFKQRWAEYLTIVVTASFIPVELFESIKHFTLIRGLLLAVNVAIVCCLLWILKKNAPQKAGPRRVGALPGAVAARAAGAIAVASVTATSSLPPS